MPLPAALRAKLLKRGIIKTSAESQPEEEIIAEDYDDNQNHTEEDNNNVRNTEVLVRIGGESYAVPGCPNKWNVYHECVPFCYERWGDGIREPKQGDEVRRLKMLRKHPLPKNWDEIYDPGTGRYYYWNKSSNEVSWLPPLHPKTKISLPASKLKEMRKNHENNRTNEREIAKTNDEPMDEDNDSSEKFVEKKLFPIKNRGGGSSGRMVKKSNDLDPMDPAAYSDTPRGNWSTGLERKGEAKTGVDTTASGPLYQMRPYPSPGAVLRANAELQKK